MDGQANDDRGIRCIIRSFKKFPGRRTWHCQVDWKAAALQGRADTMDNRFVGIEQSIPGHA